jgi:hypothetical protein
MCLTFLLVKITIILFDISQRRDLCLTRPLRVSFELFRNQLGGNLILNTRYSSIVGPRGALKS